MSPELPICETRAGDTARFVYVSAYLAAEKNEYRSTIIESVALTI